MWLRARPLGLLNQALVGTVESCQPVEKLPARVVVTPLAELYTLTRWLVRSLMYRVELLGRATMEVGL